MFIQSLGMKELTAAMQSHLIDGKQLLAMEMEDLEQVRNRNRDRNMEEAHMHADAASHDARWGTTGAYTCRVMP